MSAVGAPLPDVLTAARCAGAAASQASAAHVPVGSGDVDALSADESGAEFERSFARSHKVALARVVKVLFDLCRIAGLQRVGYRARLVRYTTCSLEDRLIVATAAHG